MHSIEKAGTKWWGDCVWPGPGPGYTACAAAAEWASMCAIFGWHCMFPSRLDSILGIKALSGTVARCAVWLSLSAFEGIELPVRGCVFQGGMS